MTHTGLSLQWRLDNDLSVHVHHETKEKHTSYAFTL